MSDTPETDALDFRAKDPSKAELAELSRRLERQRDAAVDALRKIVDLDWSAPLGVDEYARAVLREIEEGK